MRNREIAAHGGCNLFLRPKSKERATNTAFRWGYGVDMADLALEQQKAKQRMNALERTEGANYVDAGS